MPLNTCSVCEYIEKARAPSSGRDRCVAGRPARAGGAPRPASVCPGPDTRPWFLYVKLWYFWVAVFNLSHSQSLKFVSIPRSVTKVRVKLESICNVTSNDTLELLWIHNKYQKYQHKVYYGQIAPRIRKIAKHFRYFYYWNYSFYTQQGYIRNKAYTLFDSVYQLKQEGWLKLIYWNPTLWSWEDTTLICKEERGNLPYFVAREELDELLNFMKTAPHFLPSEAIYIGLNSSNWEKVRGRKFRFPIGLRCC